MQAYYVHNDHVRLYCAIIDCAADNSHGTKLLARKLAKDLIYIVNLSLNYPEYLVFDYIVDMAYEYDITDDDMIAVINDAFNILYNNYYCFTERSKNIIQSILT